MEREWERAPGQPILVVAAVTLRDGRVMICQRRPEAQVGRVCDAVYHRYSDRNVLVLFYMCEIVAGEPRALDCNAIAWVETEALRGYDFAGADRAFVERLF